MLKGDPPGPALRLRVPGGRAAHGRRLRIAGAPSFEVGERAILFLEPGRAGSYRLWHFGGCPAQ